MNSIELTSVNKFFGEHHAVSDMSFEVPEGAVYGFLGPNGAGKTSTIRMIMSILYPDSGTLKVLGDDQPERVKDRLGYLPEEKGLYKKMKVKEIITYFGTLKGMSRRDAAAEADKLLVRFGLEDAASKRCEEMSKGMGQKVQIISTLIHDPALVILDEPFSGLDPINVELVRDIILDLKHDGKTVIFSTHIMEQAEQICDSILLINKGVKLLDGKVAEVKGQFSSTLLVDYDGDPANLNRPGIVRVNNMGNSAELSVEEGADTQALLRELMDAVKLNSFTLKEPSLHEIFVRTVGESDT
ncbi:MAG: ATP-binding cassette domain-containing protein [Pseudomonadales bacterium]|nr:ATP-binding cassette domain-containing protein [Pseudomonadales bacterium]MBO6595533.1 ATP-binding cassette domain-containing protein [Pseudomonadales bacterium]MBO6657059.1 ATP-binding cassette domain-containing protein [Pseudomonadales bacterium]MBO6702033.1 ATP-binding cassette domain-containing protein [Pseudomonadales bacterium]MBO6820908.1 ATP-binding cassette domain-containing protein [Pseudomonadales bacterium]